MTPPHASRGIPVAVALGSNQGDRQSHLDYAVVRLATVLSHLRQSHVIETAPEGVPDEQPPYLNAVVVGECRLPPRALLARLLTIEQERGRERAFRYAARTLDLDLVLYGGLVLDEEGLQVPHPRFRERRFVLAPLAELAGEWTDPVTGLSISALLRRLPPSGP